MPTRHDQRVRDLAGVPADDPFGGQAGFALAFVDAWVAKVGANRDGAQRGADRAHAV
jgi:hypothetical protein